eukprot:CAMPEP_0177631926 /NCGR_PEP_ID=MMETSP0447-20121125/2012_1 /TAXON_ID=0 /ORGANISM="Stygamoeba regulata, Strain BSH-02190019" /LENGTH=376 /DNA_ID=CAMNT_0019133447 /DNA_START=9 /DNA_END=1140 /DNA_ORIENTATION=-
MKGSRMAIERIVTKPTLNKLQTGPNKVVDHASDSQVVSKSSDSEAEKSISSHSAEPQPVPTSENGDITPRKLTRRRSAVEIQNIKHATLLCEAASESDIDKLQAYVDRGYKLNEGDYDKRTALHVAAAEGQLKAVDFLLKHGASAMLKDRWGATPLDDALCNKHQVCADLLVKHGAVRTVNSDLAGKVLNRASLNDIAGLEKIFIERPAMDMVNVFDYDKRTALHVASAMGHHEMVRFLLANGANVNSADRFGGTPIEDAVRHHHTDIADLLRDAGGHPGVKPVDFLSLPKLKEQHRLELTRRVQVILQQNVGDLNRFFDALPEANKEKLRALLLPMYPSLKTSPDWLSALRDELEVNSKSGGKLKKLLGTDGPIP